MPSTALQYELRGQRGQRPDMNTYPRVPIKVGSLKVPSEFARLRHLSHQTGRCTCETSRQIRKSPISMLRPTKETPLLDILVCMAMLLY